MKFILCFMRKVPHKFLFVPSYKNARKTGEVLVMQENKKFSLCCGSYFLTLIFSYFRIRLSHVLQKCVCACRMAETWSEAFRSTEKKDYLALIRNKSWTFLCAESKKLESFTNWTVFCQERISPSFCFFFFFSKIEFCQSSVVYLKLYTCRKNSL